MLTLRRVTTQLRVALLGAVVGSIRPARLQAGPYPDKARLDASLALPLASQLLLVMAPCVQVGDWPSRLLPRVLIDGRIPEVRDQRSAVRMARIRADL